ncbi:hypothetical protein [Patulibacter sp. SYSU D01012]|uniref:hypothetical protein n=1 Tax=Patulibacter sp. SYSU D01012 TaxID=2817381 RepID=UPI001B307758|nr:hypothetical protein [Patulibacter sp. SYSU D01012]
MSAEHGPPAPVVVLLAVAAAGAGAAAGRALWTRAAARTFAGVRGPRFEAGGTVARP